ncbi:MAG: hypothetical protein QF415_07955 [Candidatus Undinarchaeales archaeon]|jgi:hypothetical protein|nr:hypothetical protein [Candidatus Undinarchaeales archaeon]MDP7492971.1 hypothetical protein [Candidatus Undinarchaeales archaeon]
MGRPLTILPVLVLAVFLAGCCCDNEVCKGKESYVPAYSESRLVEETCDDCMNVLKISTQDDICLKSTTKFASSRDMGDGTVPAGQKLYPYLHNTDDEWSECEAFGDENTKLKCGCCVLLDGKFHGENGATDLAKHYKFEGGECHTSASEEAMMSGNRWAKVPEKDYIKDNACLG